MTATRRGANNKISAFLRRREDAQRRQAKEVPEEAEAAYPEAAPESSISFSDAEKAALGAYTKPQLKERLASIGLTVGGTKAELIVRLLSAS